MGTAPIFFNGEELTAEDILKARNHHMNLSKRCIKAAIKGEIQVNDLEKYIEWRKRNIEATRKGENDHTLTLRQTAYFLKTGKSIALLP